VFFVSFVGESFARLFKVAEDVLAAASGETGDRPLGRTPYGKLRVEFHESEQDRRLRGGGTGEDPVTSAQARTRRCHMASCFLEAT
jgi:hypothetical protein